MTDPRIDFKIGVDFDEIEAQIGAKAGKLGTDFSQAFDGKATSGVQRFSGALREAGVATDTASERLRHYGDTAQNTTGRVRDLAGSLLAAIGIASTARAFATMADDFQTLQARLALASEGLGSTAEAYRELFNAAQLTRQPVAELVSVYGRFAEAGKVLGVSQNRLIDITRTTAQAMAVGGGSADSMRAALIQLGQGLASGTLRGEELNSVLEQAPRLARAMAEGLGTTVGDLRAMGKEGALSSERIIGALEAARGAVERDFAAMPTTIGGALTRVNNSVLNTVGTFDRATSISSMLAGALSGVARNADILIAAGAALSATSLVAFLSTSSTAAAVLAGIVGAFSTPVVVATAAVTALAGGLVVLSGRMRDSVENVDVARAKLAQLQAALDRGTDNAFLRQAIHDQKDLVAAIELRAQVAAGQFTTGPGHRIDAAIDAASFERAEKAMSELQKVMIAVSGVSQEFEKGTASVNAALAAGAIDAQTASIMQGLLASKYTDAGKAAAVAAEKTANFKRELDGKVSALQASLEATEKQTKSDKLLSEFELGLTKLAGLSTSAWAANTRELLRQAGATEKQTAVTELAKKAEAELLKLNELSIQTEAKRLQSITEAIRKQQEENATLGLSKDALAQYNIGKQETILLDLQRKALIPELSTAELGAINAQITAQQRLIELAREGAAKRAIVDAAEEAEKAWKKTAETIESSLTDALLRGFEAGKGFLNNLRDTAANIFQTLVLRPIIQPVASSLAGGALSLLGAAPGVANAAGGGSNLIGTLSSAGSVLGGIGAFTGTLGAGVFGGLGALTGGAGLAGTLSAAGSLIGTGSAAGIGAGLGLGAGAIAPYALAAFAGFQALKGLFGGGEKRFGAQYGIVNGQLVKLEGPSGGDPNAAASIAAITDAQRTIDALTRGFDGTSGGQISRIGFELSKNENKRFTELFVDGQGRRQSGFASNEDVGAAFATELKRSVILGLAQSDITEPIRAFFKAQDAFTLDSTQIDAVIATASAVQTMADSVANVGGVFTQLSSLSVDARTNILQLVGGLDQFNSKVAGFVGSFFSQQEQASIQAASIAGTLRAAGVDITGLDTRAEFRSIVDSLNLATDSGQQQLAALLNVAQGFAGLTDFLSTTQLTLEQLAAQAPQSELISSLTEHEDASTAVVAIGLNDVGGRISHMEDALRGAIDGLRDDLRIANAQLAASANKTAQVLDRWTVEGLPATVT